MPRRWYISFHGGDARHALNNIHVYATDGSEETTALNVHSLPKDTALRELRGFSFGPDGDLYVANAYRQYNQILRFKGHLNDAGQHDFVEVFVQRQASNRGLAHPFHAAFGPDGNLYVPSQDTSIVARFYGPQTTTGTPGTPMPPPPALRRFPLSLFHPGTFVPSARQVSTGVEEVRHTVFGPDGHLYVADPRANRIKKYDGQSGAFLDAISSKDLDKPIHLLFSPQGDVLYIGSRGNHSVLIYDVVTKQVAIFIKERYGGLHEPAGMALGHDGYLYVASRGSKQILRYNAHDGRHDAKPFIDGLKDSPEFLLPVNRT
jgi:DNA-binding beta-propeller fold protein YncE